MDRHTNDIKRELTEFSKRFGPSALVPAFVNAVNADNTVDVTTLDNTVIPGVFLRAVLSAGNMVLLVPAVNSVVVIGRVENSDESVVVAVSAITEWRVVIDNVTHSINTDGFLFQNGEVTLLSALTKVIQAVQQITVLYGNNPDYAKLIDAQNNLNSLLR